MKKLFAIFFIVIITLKCEFLPKKEIYNPEYTPKISVFAVISPDKNLNYVVVERTLKISEKNAEYYDESNRVNPIIEDAAVYLIHQQDTAQFSFYKPPSDIYYYNDYTGVYLDRINQFKAEPGQTYQLLVKIANGRVVTGTTTLPQQPVIQKPLALAELPMQSIGRETVQWQEDVNTIGYLVRFLIQQKNNSRYDNQRYNIADEEIFRESPVKFGSFLYYFSPEMSNYISETATVKVLALDRNLYDYLSKNEMATVTGVDLHLLEGGVGVFGSVNTDSVNVILK